MTSLGDLLVFVAVLVIVAVFLRVVHTFITAGEQNPETEGFQQHQHETRAKASASRESDRISESPSVSE